MSKEKLFALIKDTYNPMKGFKEIDIIHLLLSVFSMT